MSPVVMRKFMDVTDSHNKRRVKTLLKGNGEGPDYKVFVDSKPHKLLTKQEVSSEPFLEDPRRVVFLREVFHHLST